MYLSDALQQKEYIAEKEIGERGGKIIGVIERRRERESETYRNPRCIGVFIEGVLCYV